MSPTISVGTKQALAMPVLVRGYYTEYADFMYQAKNAEDPADPARVNAFFGQMALLRKAWDITTCSEAKDALSNEMSHFTHMRCNQPCLLPAELQIQHGHVEGEIFFAMDQARTILRARCSDFPVQPDSGSHIAYSIAKLPKLFKTTPCLKRKRSDSVLSHEAPPARRAKVVHLERAGQNPQRVWEAQERAHYSTRK